MTAYLDMTEPLLLNEFCNRLFGNIANASCVCL